MLDNIPGVYFERFVKFVVAFLFVFDRRLEKLALPFKFLGVLSLFGVVSASHKAKGNK